MELHCEVKNTEADHGTVSSFSFFLNKQLLPLLGSGCAYPLRLLAPTPFPAANPLRRLAGVVFLAVILLWFATLAQCGCLFRLRALQPLFWGGLQHWAIRLAVFGRVCNTGPAFERSFPALLAF